jgi:hypothetical protein
MKLLLLAVALVGGAPRAATPIAAADVPNFRFSCTASNSLDTALHPPRAPLPPATNPPATQCVPACPKVRHVLASHRGSFHTAAFEYIHWR